jgi:hypothetical protein
MSSTETNKTFGRRAAACVAVLSNAPTNSLRKIIERIFYDRPAAAGKELIRRERKDDRVAAVERQFEFS